MNEVVANTDSTDRLVLEPLTPELALVDPELARRARDRLPGPSGEVPFGPDGRGPRSAARSLPTPADDASAEVAPAGTRERQPDRPASTRHRWRKARFLAVGLLAATAVLSVLTWTRSSFRDARRDAVDPAAVRSTPLAQARRQATTAAPVSPEASTKSNTPSGVAKKRAKPSPSALPARTKTTRPANGAKPAAPKASTRSTHPSGLAKKKRAKPSPSSAFGTRVFIWAAQEHATLYKVAFFRHGKEVFEALRSEPRLELPLRWTYKHRKFRLTSGAYAWTVRPAFGPRTQLRYGKPIVQSTWVARR